MEKKTTRRIIGILVVVALVIILLPLMFNENETQAPLQASEATPPPFPGNTDPATLAENTVPASHTGEMINHIINADEQPTAEETTTVDGTQTQAQATSAPAVVVKTAQLDATTPATETTNVGQPVEPMAINDDDLQSVNLQNADLMNTATANTVPAQVIANTNKTITPAKPAAAPAPKAVVTKTITITAHNSVTTTTTVTANKIGWLVQLGSFKSKNNADRLTNALRAKGYKAFTIETKSNGQTRVCVGPEFKQLSANTLANKIAQDMNMQGIVMPYRPIAL